MSSNALTAATDAQALKGGPPAPKGYTKWFDVVFKNVIFDPSILHRKEAIEGYYIGYLTGYNTIKQKKYAILFEWTEAPSKLPNCKDFTLHVFVTPPPVFIRKGTKSLASGEALLAAPVTTMGDPDDDREIDPPPPPPPPPPTM
ncbi:MAG: hypothetical protein J7621_02190 [Niastella sp.]|nr:hypothetical protein [Niastella sp.]